MATPMRQFDIVVLGAGAAGMMAAIEAGKRGRSVLVVDHAKAPGEKIRISGGGRCNFTNLNATAKLATERFLSANPKFALSALSRYTPERFIGLVKSYGIAYHEKTLGQLFCDGSSVQVVNLLKHRGALAGWRLVPIDGRHEVEVAEREMLRIEEDRRRLASENQMLREQAHGGFRILQDVLAEVPWPVIGIDVAGQIVLANDVACERFAARGFAPGIVLAAVLPELEQVGAGDEVELDDVRYRCRWRASGDGRVLLLDEVSR